MEQFEFPFVTAYGKKSRVQKFFDDEVLTKQEFKRECDINHILSKYNRQMGVDFLNQYHGHISGRFGDVSQATDYQTALHQINEAEELFDALPSKIRARFHNDPGMLLDFIADERNRDEAVELGLMKQNAVLQPTATEEPK